MRNRKRAWALVGLVLLLLGLGWWLWQRGTTEPALEPLPVERKPVGKLPPPPQPARQDLYFEYPHATLVDFDGDGFPELLAGGAVLERGFLKPSYTAWLALEDGAAATTPLLCLMPSTTSTSGDYTVDAPLPPDSLPYAREVVAWDATVQEPLVLSRTAQGWQTRPIPALKGERLQNALAFDADKDGLLDDYLLQTQKGALAHLKLDAALRLQLQKVEPQTPPVIQQLFQHGRILAPPPAPGMKPLPPTVPETRLALPDLDADGVREFVEAGDSAQRKPAHLRLSRSRRTIALPFSAFSLSHPVEPIEIGDGAVPELAVVHRLGQTYQLTIYRVASGDLQPVAQFTTTVDSEWSPYWLRDLDGDGVSELIIADLRRGDPRVVRWRVFRYEGGAFRERASYEWRAPGRFRRLQQPLKIHSGLLLTGSYDPPFASLTGAGGEALVLVYPPEGDRSLDPARWHFLVLPDQIPVWAGDYDRDGTEELVLSGRFRETYLVQRRGAKVYGSRLSERGVARVLPARIGGTPWLVLLYRQGEVEMIRVRPETVSPASE